MMMMQVNMVYEYPIWLVGVSLMVAAVIGTILLELVIRGFVPAEFRRQHNDVAAAIFSIIGVTYAVLLAFVATAAWEDFNKAKAASYQEAGSILDVFRAADGAAMPARADLVDQLTRYTRAVIAVEWPGQAKGHVMHAGDQYLEAMHRIAIGMNPSSAAETNRHALLLQSLMHLEDARQDRLLAAETTIPAIIWFVLIIGGTITIAFGSFLGASSLRMHLGMCAMLAISGVLVLVLIIALSNPFRGDFRVSTAPFESVLSRMSGSS